MLVACRVAGLSALEAHYADVNAERAIRQSGEKSRGLADRVPGAWSLLSPAFANLRSI